MIRDQVFARALVLAGDLDGRQQERLQVLCGAAMDILEARLRDGMAPEDCREAFVTAAGLQALEMLESFGEVSEFRAGDLTVKLKEDREGRRQGLRHQAEELMRPYLKDTFLFTGV